MRALAAGFSQVVGDVRGDRGGASIANQVDMGILADILQ
jgi:hypothetical protein